MRYGNSSFYHNFGRKRCFIWHKVPFVYQAYINISFAYNQYVYIDLGTLSVLVKCAMMTENALEGCNGPVSQTIVSVKALLQWKKISTDPLPADVSLDNGRLILILSNKKDVYYTCTSIKCSCPANTYNPGQHSSIRGNTFHSQRWK